ncbi:hypothetical protein HHI36_012934 [Cryptolaemus montrouzieri]|uniref:Uncharacterized protein n=1 Tax=Cryptolaemus montrouzieri TaxID=559131 RepID=A0ABD2NGP4_9CUCU
MSFRSEIFSKAHRGHMGISKCKSLLKDHDQMRKYYRSRKKPLAKLKINQEVLFQKCKEIAWLPTILIEFLGNRSYMLKFDNGIMYRRNRIYIKERHYSKDSESESSQNDNQSTIHSNLSKTF